LGKLGKKKNLAERAANLAEARKVPPPHLSFFYFSPSLEVSSFLQVVLAIKNICKNVPTQSEAFIILAHWIYSIFFSAHMTK
jgi:hypothetical protein